MPHFLQMRRVRRGSWRSGSLHRWRMVTRNHWPASPDCPCREPRLSPDLPSAELHRERGCPGCRPEPQGAYGWQGNSRDLSAPALMPRDHRTTIPFAEFPVAFGVIPDFLVTFAQPFPDLLI